LLYRKLFPGVITIRSFAAYHSNTSLLTAIFLGAHSHICTFGYWLIAFYTLKAVPFVNNHLAVI
jgi:hypothetical protein